MSPVIDKARGMDAIIRRMSVRANRFAGVRGSRGVTIVEFALVLPLLFGLMFSICDFGLYFFAQHTLQFATREGVRLALVGRMLDDGQGNALSREASIVKTITDNASIAIPPGKLSISIYPVDPAYADPEGWEGIRDAGLPGSYMRVRTRYEYKFITPVFGVFSRSGTLPVRAQATYRNELFGT